MREEGGGREGEDGYREMRMAGSKRRLNGVQLAGWLANCLANGPGGCLFAWLPGGGLAKVSDGWPATCMTACHPMHPSSRSRHACLLSFPSYAARDRETGSERETHGSEWRLAERPTVHVAGWLAEPLLGWLPFCWLVGGVASDCMFSRATTMFLCCLPLLVRLPACLPDCLPSLPRIRCRLAGAGLPCRLPRFRDDQFAAILCVRRATPCSCLTIRERGGERKGKRGREGGERERK